MKILLIDDNVVTQSHMKDVLLADGHDVMIAKDGEEGMLFLDKNPDVVVLDLYMPKMNGWEFLDIKAKSTHAEIPVVVASNWAVLPQPIPENAGVTDILFKDMDHTSLVLTTLHRRFHEESDIGNGIARSASTGNA